MSALSTFAELVRKVGKEQREETMISDEVLWLVNFPFIYTPDSR